MIIKFDSKKPEMVITIDCPVISINSIDFLSNDKNWRQRLFNSSLKVKFECVEKIKHDSKSSQERLDFGAYITSSQKQTKMVVNRLFSFKDTFKFADDIECKKWKISLELCNLTIGQDESLEISITDKDFLLKRIKDWNTRIKNLYTEIEQWLPNQYNLKLGGPSIMYEELMQNFKITPVNIDTADIFKVSKFIMSIKPKGLWIIGANGRVDIISLVGNYILVDIAEQFQKPQWHIYTPNNKQISEPFTKSVLLKLIDLMK